MFCRNCGVSIPDDSHFCPKCGTKVFEQKQSPISSSKSNPSRNQSVRRIESHHGGDGHLLRDVAMLVGGLVAVGIGYVMWIGSTVNAYLGARTSDYYAVFGRNAPDASQWAIGCFGAIINIAGAICLYIAVCPIAQRFGAWRKQNKVMGTILAIVICLAVFVCFSIKTSATGQFGVWDYLIMAAIFGGMWKGGKQKPENREGRSANVAHVLFSGGRVVLAVCVAFTIIAVICWCVVNKKNGEVNLDASIAIDNITAKKELNTDAKYGTKKVAYSKGLKSRQQKAREKKSLRRLSDDEVDVGIAANTASSSNRKCGGDVLDYDNMTDEEIDARIAVLEGKNFLKAFMEGRYRDAAKLIDSIDHDNLDVQYALGIMYEHGYGVIRNEAEAVKWYRKAAERGDAAAQFRLGTCYEHGRGVVKDGSVAVRLYHASAVQGNVYAQFALGGCYGLGIGVIKNEEEAMKWYRKAADQGHVDAQFMLGQYYNLGMGCARDVVEAIKWYRKAAAQGDKESQEIMKKYKEIW